MVDVSAQLNLEAEKSLPEHVHIGITKICRDILEGDVVAMGCFDTVVRLWDIKTGANTLLWKAPRGDLAMEINTGKLAAQPMFTPDVPRLRKAS